VLTQIKTRIDTVNTANSLGLTVTQLKGTIEISGSTAFTLTAKGGISSEELKAFQDEVDNFSQLPAESIHNRVVKINNTVAKEELPRWNKGGGKVLPGLVRRREAEVKFFTS
jgi:hypothetical protein